MSHLPKGTAELIRAALEEDIGSGDVTSEATVPAGRKARAHLIQKEPGVIFGLDLVEKVFSRLGSGEVDRTVIEGHWHEEAPRNIAMITDSARNLLAGERVALNFLGHLSGIATLTARFVDAVAGTGVRILDTRKTTPCMRALEKRAVSWGGGLNHRMGLFDSILIKENHIEVAGGLAEAVWACSEFSPDRMVEVEAENLEQVREALEVGVGRILLDNMTPPELSAAVAARDLAGGGVELEASGGITLGNVRAAAESGVDFISIGALTHSAPQLDLSMLIEPSA